MLALCLMLLKTYYAQNYAGIIGLGLASVVPNVATTLKLSIIVGQYWNFKVMIQYVTGPAKRDQVGTKYTISYNCKYLKLHGQYSLSVSLKMLQFIDDKKISLQWLQQIISYDAINLIKPYVPIWFIFIGPVTYEKISQYY